MGNLSSSTQNSSDVLINDLTFLVSVLLSINYYVYPQTGIPRIPEGSENHTLEAEGISYMQNASALQPVPGEPQRPARFSRRKPLTESSTQDEQRRSRLATLIKTYKTCRHSIVQRTKARGGGRWLFGRDDRKEPNDVGVADNLDQLKRLVILDIRNCVARLYMAYMVNLGKNTVALSQSSGRGGSLGAGPTSATVAATAADAITNHLMYSNDFCQVMVERVIQTVLPQNTLDVLRQKELRVMKLLRATMSMIRKLSDSVRDSLFALHLANPQINADDRREKTALGLFRMTCDCIRDQFDHLLRSTAHKHFINTRSQDDLANMIARFMDNVAKSLIEWRDLIAAIFESRPIPCLSFALPNIDKFLLYAQQLQRKG
ncbi:hypothetical protein DFS34DRAFT_696096 [Phlyctochytrium arcticum]|nr:hypothetical protein DFS34DRAFT_696096 [Phlyctochytrium arcticum]